MKGQAVNIDWTIGLSVFLVTLLTGTTILLQFDPGPDESVGLQQQTSIVHQNLEENTSVETRIAPLYINSESDIGIIPFEHKYTFSNNYFPNSQYIEAPSQTEPETEKIFAAVNTSVNQYNLTYFQSDNKNLTYENSIQTGQEIDNNIIQVEPESPGLQSLRINDQEVLQDEAEIDANSFSIDEEEVYASSLDGDLRVYDQSPELIIGKDSEMVFRVRDFDDLYWGATETRYDLDGEGEIQSGDTPGLTVSSDFGATFVGDMYAEVSRNDGEVEIRVNPEQKLRLNLHEENWEFGEERISFHQEDPVFFGVEEELYIPTLERIRKLENVSESAFESELGLVDWGYRVRVGDIINRGRDIPLVDVYSSDHVTALIGRYGNRTTVGTEVQIWR